MNEECLICKAPLEYLDADEEMECVLYSQFRCHGEKVNKIKEFGVWETVSSATLIDTAYFNNDRYSSESPDKTVFEQFSFTNLNL